MTRKKPIEVQGHRGARGLKPENTLPSFEVALDAGVSAIETDVRLTADGVPILFHDDLLTDRVCRVAPPFAGRRRFPRGAVHLLVHVGRVTLLPR